MDFGLGLVLSFTDNATAGINNAVNSLGHLTDVAEGASNSLNSMASLSALSVVSGQIGSSFTSMGSTILSTLGQIISKVNETGTTMLQAENQLGKLYEGSGKTGKDVLKDIQSYAKESIFNFEDLIPVVTMLKANGIEAFDKIASSTGKANQTLMDYAADLAAFNPQMKNAYGTGIQAAMGALNEYIAEGNARSLKSGASLDITALLGEDKGKTIEERSRQVADLMEQLNMVGMTAQLAGTPMQRLANMEDVLFDVTSRIASSGVYDEFSKIIEKISDYVFAIPDDELQNIADTIGGALTAIMKPVEKAVDGLLKLCDVVRGLIANNPALAKFAVIGTAIGGALLVFVGVALKATSALSGLSLMLLTFGKSFNDIGGLLRTGSLKMLSVLLPLTVTVGLLRLAWKNDFAGIKTNTIAFVTNLKNSFTTARDAVNGSVGDLVSTLHDLNSRNDFFSNLTIGIMKLMVLFRALAEGWNDYTLSEDTFLKAKELGILPLIEAIFDLKYRFDNFKAGFIQGWHDIGEKIRSVVEGIAKRCKGTIFEDLFDKATKFFQALSNNDADAWYQFGYSFAGFTAKAIAFGLALKGIEKALGFATKVYNLVKGISKIGGGITKLFSGVKGLFVKMFPYISEFIGAIGDAFSMFSMGISDGLGVAESLELALQTAFAPLAGVVSIVGGAILSVFNFLSMLKNGFSWVKEALMVLGIALVAVGAIILGAPALIAGVVAGIVALIATIVVVVKQHWEQIKSFIGNIASWINEHIIQPILNFFSPMFDLIKQMWESFMGTVQHVVERVKGFIDELIAGVKSIWDNIMSFITPCIETFNELKDTFKEFCSFIGDKLSNLWTGTVQPVLSAIGSFFESVFNKIASVVTTVWNGIWNTISPIVMAIWNTIQSVFTAIFDTIMNVLSSIWQGIVGVFNGIVTFIGSILRGIFQTISNVLMAIMNFIMGKHDEAKQNISNAWEAIKSIFSGALQGIAQVVSSIFTAIGNVISSIWNGIKSFFSAIWSGISSIFSSVLSSISSVVSGAFNSIKSFITSAMNAVKSVVTSIWSAITGVFNSAINTAKSAVTNGINAIKTGFSNGLNAVKSTVSSVFDSIKSKISSVMEGAKSIVTNAVSKFKSAFNFSWKLPDLKLPHVSVSGGVAPFGIAGKGSLPHFSVSWYKQGGVFDKPSVIGVGEAGTEAVMPLENNTEWIGVLAGMITSKMGQMSSLTPVNNTTSNSTVNNDGGTYLTTNNNNTQNVGGNTDNSVTFNQGAINITVQNASEEEALKLAKFIMQYIQRQTQLNNMAQYA